MPDGATALFSNEGDNVLLKELKDFRAACEEGKFTHFADAEPIASC